ncbi:unnamed protein product [Acanthoscelides obtectus]|uniref:Uncharacterized protein n=1 Tax=Acanthoscelides obtectus TaxID=200917 RepID=A0A9P0MBG7_ACAOB|nr:unnamed protein product [Acanthoscelides obtectus]CAK1630143.1 hypothetical protein AOBTE_LOCUS6173 [Acanthoscelides obtectus]
MHLKIDITHISANSRPTRWTLQYGDRYTYSPSSSLDLKTDSCHGVTSSPDLYPQWTGNPRWPKNENNREIKQSSCLCLCFLQNFVMRENHLHVIYIIY